MNTPDNMPSAGEAARLEARASDSARAYQAGRDQYIAERDLHLHYETGVRRARRALVGSIPVTECPYPGLAAFEEDQSGWFFGRDAVTADLLVRLDERLRHGGALAVVAPSGAGKSSLLRAGLLPALARGALPASGSTRWPRVLLTPTAHPGAALSAHLAETLGVTPQGAGRGPQEYAARVRAALGTNGSSGRRLVLVVDQLEELFTLCGNERERRDFLDVLTVLARPHSAGNGPTALVVLGLRSDFYTPCVGYPQLRSALQNAQLVVGSLTEAELLEAIALPARAVGLDVEPGLIELLLRDLGAGTGDGSSVAAGLPQGYEAGRLPLLAHALRATWQQRHGHVLTVAGYQSTGGIRNAVTTTADRIFQSLDPAGKNIACSLFLRLVKIGDGADDARRRLPRADLVDTGPDTTGTAAVLAAFTQGRLLTQHQDTVEITHEVLLRAWPRLREWIEADRDGHLVQQNLEEAAAAWQQARHDTGMLYRGHRLQTARAWANGPHRDRIGPVAAVFLDASVHHFQRGARMRRAAVAVLTALALIATSAAVLALQQRSSAQAQRDEALFSRVKAEAGALREDQASLAAQVNLTAHRMRPHDPDVLTRVIEDAGSPLSEPLHGGTGPFSAMVFSRDGGLLAAAGDDGSVQLWRFPRSAEPELVSRTVSDTEGPVYAVAITPDGRLLATANNDGSARLFDIADPAHPRPLGRTPATGSDAGATVGVAISGDGTLMASASNIAQAQLWDTSNPRQPQLLTQLPANVDAICSVVFSPTGRYLAGSSDDGTVQLWDVRRPSAPVPLGHISDIPSHTNVLDVEGTAVFSPDEKTLASGGSDGLVRLWDISDKRHPVLLSEPLPHEFSAVTDVAFSPDGTRLATSSTNQPVRIWNLADLTDVPLMEVLHGHRIGARALAFRPHDDSLVTAGADSAPLMWHLRRTVLNRHAGLVLSQSFGHDDHTMVTVSDEGAISHWNIRDVSRPTLLDSGRFERLPSDSYIDDWPAVIAVSPNGRTMALARSQGAGVELWDIADLHHAKKLGTVGSKSDLVFTTLAFSPNGRVLAAGDQMTPWLWDVSNPRHATLLHQIPRNRGTRDDVEQLTFSPDGRLLAALNAVEGQVTLWSMADPEHPTFASRTKKIPSNGEHSTAMAFSPKGNLMATGGDRGKIRLWAVSDSGAASGRGSLTIPTGVVTTLAFSPNERLLASGGEDTMLRLWDVSAPSEPVAFGQPLTGHTRAIDTVAFAPNAPLLVSDSYDGTVRLWPTDTSHDIGLVCKASANTLTRAEWNLHLSGLPYDPPCP
ncbi:hypothetical protein [Streptomyces sp. NPDC126514]|uniref:nSTAND1 domain-containing NTPase n=1 Tax=Streptomyces sp. NPDC126514 TaxID=3155210 RepID=UPI0033214A9D